VALWRDESPGWMGASGNGRGFNEDQGRILRPGRRAPAGTFRTSVGEHAAPAVTQQPSAQHSPRDGGQHLPVPQFPQGLGSGWMPCSSPRPRGPACFRGQCVAGDGPPPPPSPPPPGAGRGTRRRSRAEGKGRGGGFCFAPWQEISVEMGLSWVQGAGQGGPPNLPLGDLRPPTLGQV